jgi:hypothetical protein
MSKRNEPQTPHLRSSYGVPANEMRLINSTVRLTGEAVTARAPEGLSREGG